MAEQRLGATRAEWLHFAAKLDLGRYLLPAVANPQARVADRSNLKDGHLGKVPSLYTSEREVVGIKDWTQKVTSSAEIKRWMQEPDYSICLQQKAVVAFDVDVTDPDLCAALVAHIQSNLGPAPMRWRENSAKVLLLYRLDREHTIEELPKKVLTFRPGVGNEGDKVELLGPGQQAVVAGTHPSGARIQWEGLPDSLEGMTQITAEEAQQMMAQLSALYPGGKLTLSSGSRLIPVTDPEVLERLRAAGDPVVPWLVEEGWALGESSDGKIFVRCPWEEEHSSQGDLTETVYLPLGYRDVATRGFQCLHAHCQGRNAPAFLRQIGYDRPEEGFDDLDEVDPLDDLSEVEALVGPISRPVREFDPFARPPGAPEVPELDRRIPKGTNAGQRPALPDLFDAIWLRPDLSGFRLSWDSFAGQPSILWREDWERWVAGGRKGDVPWKLICDKTYVDVSALTTRPISKGGLGFVSCGPETVRTRLLGLAGPPEETERPPRGGEEWGRWRDSGVELGHRLAAKWDGERRIDTFLTRYFEAEDNEYVRAVSRYVMTALAGRLMYLEQCETAGEYYAGIKADMALVMVGRQGQGKTAAIEALAWDAPGRAATVSFDRINSVDLQREMKAACLYHMGELRGLSDAKLETVKEWLTRRSDSWVEKYQSTRRTYPRRGIFIGDTNRDDFLGDLTGNRRWLPVDVGDADVLGLVRDRDQLWGEAVALWREHGILWQDAHALGDVGREGFEAEVPYYETVLNWLMAPLDGAMFEDANLELCNWQSPEGISTDYIARHVLRETGSSAYGARAIQMKVGEILRFLGGEKRRYGPKEVRVSRYFFDKAPAPRRAEVRFTKELRDIRIKGNDTQH